ncbi:hypothetical protein ABH973_000730 [Bradyrhizobium ottawaense]
MNSVTVAFPDRKLHVILDNLNTHKKVRPGSTRSRCGSQSCGGGQSLSGTSFTSPKQLQEHIDAYVNAYNDKAEPFVWTKKKICQRHFKGRRITQL